MKIQKSLKVQMDLKLGYNNSVKSPPELDDDNKIISFMEEYKKGLLEQEKRRLQMLLDPVDDLKEM